MSLDLYRDIPPKRGHTAMQIVEWYGSNLVEVLSYEPDARTYREKFYYNARENILYRKIGTSPLMTWKPISRR